jgi:hypothetical protein
MYYKVAHFLKKQEPTYMFQIYIFLKEKNEIWKKTIMLKIYEIWLNFDHSKSEPP